MNPWLFIFGPFALIVLVMYVCKWAEAYDKYKTFDDSFDLIMMGITTCIGFSIAYGFYKLIFNS
jgi:hypothetical protein